MLLMAMGWLDCCIHLAAVAGAMPAGTQVGQGTVSRARMEMLSSNSIGVAYWNCCFIPSAGQPFKVISVPALGCMAHVSFLLR